MALHNPAANALETGGGQEIEIIDDKQVVEDNDKHDTNWLTSNVAILIAGGGDDNFRHKGCGGGHLHARR